MMRIDDSALLFPVGGAEERRHVRRQGQRHRREGRYRSDQDRRSGKQTELSGQIYLQIVVILPFFKKLSSCSFVSEA